MRIRIGSDLDVTWDDPTITAPVGSLRIVLIEMTSHRREPTHLHLTGSRSEQILFWTKPVTVDSDAPRYTFVCVAPFEPGPAEASISVDWHENRTTTFAIHADGTLPATYDWYHQPAANFDAIDGAVDPESPGQTSSSGSRTSHRIRFRIRDHETGEPLPVRVEVRDADGNAYWTPLRGCLPSLPKTSESLDFILERPFIWSFDKLFFIF